MYSDQYSEEIVRKLKKIKKKNAKHYNIICKKMEWIFR